MMFFDRESGAVGDTFDADNHAYIPGDDRYSRILKWLVARYPAGSMYESMKDGRPGRFRKYAVPYSWRDMLTNKFSWAIPSPDALWEIRKASGGKVVEVGAGLGYWASLLAADGVEVVAFDAETDYEKNDYHNGKAFFPVQKASASEVDFTSYADHALFICWPPYLNAMAAEAVKAYHAAGGETVIYIGEGGGGSTGDDALHELLDEGWDDDDDDDDDDDEPLYTKHFRLDYHKFARWSGLRDRLTVYRRKYTQDTPDVLKEGQGEDGGTNGRT